MDSMSLSKLILSLGRFELALHRAEEASTDSDPEVRKRLQSYHLVLAQQRDLALVLCEHTASGDWAAAAQCLAAIRGLSTLIREDASGLIERATAVSTARQPAQAVAVSGPANTPSLIGMRRVA